MLLPLVPVVAVLLTSAIVTAPSSSWFTLDSGPSFPSLTHHQPLQCGYNRNVLAQVPARQQEGGMEGQFALQSGTKGSWRYTISREALLFVTTITHYIKMSDAE